MENLFFGGMVLKDADASAIVSGAEGSKPEFEGIISNSKVDRAYEQMSPRALRSFAREAQKGVKVLAEHNNQSQPIGRSLRGRYDNKEEATYSRFYIQRGLDLRGGFDGGGYANTDSYIAAAEAGTTRDLSIGAFINKETCDFCGAEMKRVSFFGMTFISDENGHYPGQKIYIDKDGERTTEVTKRLSKERVTATIEDADLVEFSLVAFGAVPNAEIQQSLRKAWEDGKLTESHLAQLNDRFAIKSSESGLIFPISALDTGSGSGTASSRSSIVVPKRIGGSTMSVEQLEKDLQVSKELNESLQKTLEDTTTELELAREKITQLEQFEEQVTHLQDALKSKDDDIADLEANMSEVKANQYRLKQLDDELAKERAQAMHQYTRANPTASEKAREAEEAKLENIHDLDALRAHKNLWRDIAREKWSRTDGTAPSPSLRHDPSDDSRYI